MGTSWCKEQDGPEGPLEGTLPKSELLLSESSLGWATTLAAGPLNIAVRPRPWREPTDQFTVGEVLGGRYQLAEQLGQGSFGKVFRAHDRMADETVAIKLLSYDRQQAPDAVAQLRSELRAARKVTHPGIVRIHDVIDLGDRLALSMELVSGETLKEHLTRLGRLEETKLRALGADLARALEAAHGAGVVHCDLKPANILLRRSTGRAVIADFGISRLQPPPCDPDHEKTVDEVTDPGHGHGRAPGGSTPEATFAQDPAEDVRDPELIEITVSVNTTFGLTAVERNVFGTPLYMAPELFESQGELSPAVDLYALGVVLYEAATGIRPHERTDLCEVVHARLTEPPIPLHELRPDLSPELCRVIEGCLERDPTRRLTSTAVAQALTRAQAGPAARRWGIPLLALLLGLAGAGLWWGSGRLPLGERRVYVEATFVRAPRTPGDAGGPEASLADAPAGTSDRWLGQAIGRLGAARLRQGERRFAVVDARARANVIVRLQASQLRSPGRGVAIAVTVARSGGRERVLGTVEAASVNEALGPLVERVAALVGDGRSVPGPDADEVGAMKRLGTASIAAYRLYRQAIDDFFRSVLADVPTSEQRLEAAIEQDPGWAHPHAALVLVAGRVTPRARALLERGRKLTDPRRDPIGQALLASLELGAAGQLDRARQRLEQALPATSDDLLGLDLLGTFHALLGRAEDEVEAYGRLHRLRPDLQFGANLALALERAGRGGEVPALARGWLERAPESEQALVTAITLDLAAGRHDQAERRARALFLVHGETAHRLVLLCDVLLAAGRTREARAVASRLVEGGERERALGLYRLGVIAVLEGRFGAAHESLVASAQAQRPFGTESELLPTLEALVRMDERLHLDEDRASHLAELEETFALFDMPARAAVTRYERALPRRPGPDPELDPDPDASPRRAQEKTCPAPEGFLAALGPTRERGVAERDMLRAASEVGCVPCAAVLRAGIEADERSTRSIFRFAACAEAEGAPLLAADAFRRASALIASSLAMTHGLAPDLAVLAHFRLGRMLESLGRTTEARGEYERFLGFWGHADRPIAEVATARQALARLQ
ncbi:MAG TPA: protein kinase [Polyangia bacterium]|nr:protein kinase [Polyangia bacterium]